MATSPDVATLERETAEARARLADTLEKLTSPATAEAVKQELSDYAQGLKNQALEYVQQKKDDLLGTGKNKARGVKNDWTEKALANPLGLALIGAGIGWHLYKKPPITSLLVGSGIALLMRGGNSAQRHFHLFHDPYNREHPAAYVPGGVAGYGYPVEEEAPGTSVPNRAGAAIAHAGGTARDLGERVREAASDVAARVSGAAESARTTIAATAASARDAASSAVDSTRQAISDVVESTRETVMGAAENASASTLNAAASVRTSVSNAAEAARTSVRGAADSTRTTASDFVQRTTSSASQAADAAAQRASALLQQTQKNPLLLGALGLIVGTAAVYALRGTRQADRLAGETRESVGRTARRTGQQARRRAQSAARSASERASDASQGVSAAASRVTDTAGEVAASAAATASDIGSAAGRAFENAGEAVSSAAGSAYEGASSAYRSAAGLAQRAGRRAPDATRYVQRQFTDLGERYPLLLGLTSLAIGAAVGGSMRLSQSEQRLMGPYSDRLKQRAWEVADEQFGYAKEAAEQLADHFKTQASGERSDQSADFETVIGGGKPPVEERQGTSPDGGARRTPSA